MGELLTDVPWDFFIPEGHPALDMSSEEIRERSEKASVMADRPKNT